MRKFAFVGMGGMLLGFAAAAGAQPVPVDPVFGDGLEPGIVFFGPNTTRVLAGATDVVTSPVPLRVSLSEVAVSDTFIPITSSDPARLTVVGGGTTVPAGLAFEFVTVTAASNSQSAVPVILTTARLGVSRSAGVRVEAVLNETDLALEADFCNIQFPASFSVVVGAVTPTIFGRLFEAGVTEPPGAPANVYAELGYAVQGSDPRTLSGWTFVAAAYNTQVGNDDEFQGAFLAPMQPGIYTYTYRFSLDNGASYTYCDVNGAGANPGLTFEVANLGAMTVTGANTGGLTINEIDYDQVGSDTGEFIELFNSSSASISLSGKSLVLVNGANNTTYLTIDLTPGGALAPGAYLVIRTNTVVPAPGTVSILFPLAMDNIQNGSPDAIALVDTIANTLIDALSYEGSITAAMIAGLGTVNLVEGSPLPVATADSNVAVGTLARIPNGADTNNAASDWSFTSTPTPGAANVP